MQSTINVIDLIDGDRFMFNTDILTVKRTSSGTVRRTGERFHIVDYTDGTGHTFFESDKWFITIFGA